MIRSRNVAFLLFSLCFCLLSSFKIHETARPLQKQALKRIIIDPGHGGTEIGARGRYSTESQITLAISLELEKVLKEELPDVDIIMTRKTDIFHSVIQKANFANEAKGDLFVCIHVNSARAITHREFIGYKNITAYRGRGKKKKKITQRVKDYRTWTSPNPAKGTETFIYGVDKTNQRKAAASEGIDEYMDSVSVQELRSRKQLDASDPTQQMLANILTQQYFQRSAKLALTIEEEFEKVGRISRQAQQRKKGIWVLQAVTMPAVLVETGFISNPEEEDYLNSEKGRQEIVSAITSAIKLYRSSLEKQMGVSGSAGKK